MEIAAGKFLYPMIPLNDITLLTFYETVMNPLREGTLRRH